MAFSPAMGFLDTKDIDGVLDSVALDELSLLTGAGAERSGSDTVDVAEAAEGGLVDHRDGVGGNVFGEPTELFNANELEFEHLQAPY